MDKAAEKAGGEFVGLTFNDLGFDNMKINVDHEYDIPLFIKKAGLY